MRKVLIATLTLALYGLAQDLVPLQLVGIEASYKTATNEEKKVIIQREIHPKCLEFAMSPDLLWSGNFVDASVPSECKKDIVTTKGMIQPMSVHPEVETYGELEVLNFIKHAKANPAHYMLVDSRTNPWFDQQTIPTSINIPWNEIYLQEYFEKEYERALELLGIKDLGNEKFDTSQAKVIVIYCNGPWCVQSPRMIHRLIEMGYPAKNIKWYRGGIHAWNSLGLSVVEDAGR